MAERTTDRPLPLPCLTLLSILILHIPQLSPPNTLYSGVVNFECPVCRVMRSVASERAYGEHAVNRDCSIASPVRNKSPKGRDRRFGEIAVLRKYSTNLACGALGRSLRLILDGDMRLLRRRVSPCDAADATGAIATRTEPGRRPCGCKCKRK